MSVQKFVEGLGDAEGVPRLVLLPEGELVRTPWLLLLPEPWGT